MKTKYILGTIAMLLFIFINVVLFYKAKHARETSENILKEFKKIDQSLQDSNQKLLRNDTISSKEIDSLTSDLKMYK